jgi:flagellar FliL protein
MEDALAEEKKKGEHEGEKGNKPKRSPIFLIGALGLFLVLFGGGGLFAWKILFSPPEKKESMTNGKNDAKQIGPIYPLDTFLVNLADHDVSRYLKLTIKLEMDNADLAQELDKRIPQLRDTIIGLLTMKTYNEVSTYKGKTILRSEIMERINRSLSKGAIKNVYFTEFIIQ